MNPSSFSRSDGSPRPRQAGISRRGSDRPLAPAAALRRVLVGVLAACLLCVAAAPARAEDADAARRGGYRTVKVDGLSIFYREAGPAAADAPTLLLLHGLPSSSRMFDPLLARLAER